MNQEDGLVVLLNVHGNYMPYQSQYTGIRVVRLGIRINYVRRGSPTHILFLSSDIPQRSSSTGKLRYVSCSQKYMPYQSCDIVRLPVDI
jgi:hypothetical protein